MLCPRKTLIDNSYAGAKVCGALVEEAAVLLAGLEVYDGDRYDREPNGEHVVLDRAEAADLHRKKGTGFVSEIAISLFLRPRYTVK